MPSSGDSSRRLQAVVTAILLTVGTAHAGPFTQLVVFGDSHSDTGDFAPGISQHNFGQRGSDGPLWVEVFAQQLDLAPPTPSRGGGLNYGWGGARTGFGIDRIAGYSIPTIGATIDDYLADNVPDGTELFVVFGGDNDFILHRQPDAAIPVANLADYVSTLAAAGGQYFIVPNQPLLGSWPGVRGTSRQRPLDRVTDKFNELLLAELGPLASELGVTIYSVDVFGLVQDVIADPAARPGRSRVTSASLATSELVMKLAVGAWGSSIRRGRSRWAGAWP